MRCRNWIRIQKEKEKRMLFSGHDALLWILKEKEVCMKRIMISVLIFWMFVFGAETFAQPVIKGSSGGGHRPECGGCMILRRLRLLPVR
jgi:hypothetical protein